MDLARPQFRTSHTVFEAVSYTVRPTPAQLKNVLRPDVKRHHGALDVH